MANEEVKIDLEINNTTRLMLNLELLTNTLNEDTINVIQSFLSKKEYIEGIEKKTRELYTPILNSICYGKEFQVGKVYVIECFKKCVYECFNDIQSSNDRVWVCFEVSKISNLFITIKELVSVNEWLEPKEIMVYYSGRNIVRQNINLAGDFTFILDREYNDGKKQLCLCPNKCIEFNKLSHLNYYYRNQWGGLSGEQEEIKLNMNSPLDFGVTFEPI